MIPLSPLPELPGGPWLYVLLAAIVVASGVPALAVVIAAEPILMMVIGLSGTGHRLSIVTLLAVVVAASVLGDALSYGLGRLLGPKLLRARIFRRLRPRIVGAQYSVQRRGTMSALFVQRWIPPTRGLVPAVLGAAGKPFGEFVSFSALAAAVWASVIVLGSYVGGPGLMLAMPAVIFLVPAVHAARRLLLRNRSHATRPGPAMPGAADKPPGAFVAFSLAAVAIGGFVMFGRHGGSPELMLAMPAVLLVVPALRASRRVLRRMRNRPAACPVRNPARPYQPH
jgi:membrane protein DedA with SNARE-associated domain